MKIYNTYAEAKAENPNSEIVTTQNNWVGHNCFAGKFRAMHHEAGPSLRNGFWEICNPEDYEEKKTEWNGEGYPPVGTECEVSNCGQAWKDCVVKFVGTDLCVVNHGSWEQHYYLNSVKFRPLETPEQRKEREELEAAYDLYCEWSKLKSHKSLQI